MSLKITVGCDPEIALYDPKKQKFVSAEGIVPGDKLNPHKVKKGTIQTDGFAAEIGIDPASSAQEFYDNIQTVLGELRDRTTGLEFRFIDHVIFDDDVYKNQSEEGRQLGCMPDYSAYTRLANPMPVPNPPSMRTFSGHVHIGWCEDADVSDPGHFADAIVVAKQMDWSLGVPTSLWNPKSLRRQLYGKAGAFRVKPYGMEYRTPDNGWLVSEERIKMVFDNTVLGMTELYKGNHYSARYNPQSIIDRGTESGYVPGYLHELKIPYIPAEVVKTPKVVMPKIKVA